MTNDKKIQFRALPLCEDGRPAEAVLVDKYIELYMVNCYID